MEKNKYLTPIIVVIAVIVVVGGYFAWQRYQRERAVRQLVGDLGNAFSGKNAGDLAKLAEEASKFAGETGNNWPPEGAQEEQSPADVYGGAEEVGGGGALVDKANSEIKPILAEVFGGAKLTGFFSNITGMGDDSGSVTFTLKRVFASGDANKLTSALTSNGYSITSSGQSDGSATILASKNGEQHTFSADNDSQELVVVVFKMPSFGN